MKSRVSVLLPIFCWVLLGLAQQGLAQGCGTSVSGGGVTGTWTPAGSPYCIQGDVLANQLTIQPGVTVIFQGDYLFDVVTPMHANGTSDAPILFTAADPSTGWKGIRFQSVQPGSSLSYCQVEYANDSGLRIIDTRVVIGHCVFRNNSSDAGGGGVRISLASGDLTLTNCEIRDNTANQAHGGGIHAVMGSGTLRLEGCNIHGNRTTTANHANLVGGGIRISGDSEFLNCVVSDNDTYGYQHLDPYSRGGGVYSDSGTARWENCVIRDNTATTRAAGGTTWPTYSHGGGVYVHSGTLTAVACILAGNDLVVTKGSPSNHRGGGLYVNSGSVTLENCTIARNDLQGVHRSGGTVDVRNTILFFNNDNGAQHSGAVTFNFCDIQNWTPDSQGNFGYNPAFAGPGHTQADLLLLPGSACIDAGDPRSQFYDGASPPSHGEVTNDVGAFGGPNSGHWLEPSWYSTWSDLGSGLAGAFGVPSLTAWGSLEGGTGATLSLSGTFQLATAYFLVAWERMDVPFRGGTLVPDFVGNGFLVPIPTDASGSAQVQVNWPPGIPPGHVFYAQWWIVDSAGPVGFSASNAISGTTP